MSIARFLRRGAGPVVAVLGGLLAVPAQAADANLTVTVQQRWAVTVQAGTWSPYLVDIKNTGAGDFTGDVVMVANEGRGTAPSAGWPEYRTRVGVPRGGERSLNVYVLEGPAGYHAEVRDLSGKSVATAEAAFAQRTSMAVGLLSEVRQGEVGITQAGRFLSPGVAVSRFPSAQAFPSNAVFLSGLQAVVIDDFDSGSLSEAQVRSLRDFVGLGGSLVVAGGSSWRRTLQPLPAELLPLVPRASGTASLAPLADLGMQSTVQLAAIVTGDLAPGGRVVLAAPDGPPLEVEGTYGAGRIIEMTFDPLSDPIISSGDLSLVSWSQGLARAFSSISPTGSRISVQGGLAPIGSGPTRTVPVASVATGFAGGAADSTILSILQDTPQAATPPVAVIGGLLVLYVILAGPLNYLVLKGAHRRELMWLTVPVVAVLFTAVAYGAGGLTRGGDFFDNEIQLQRMAPGGALETDAYHGIYNPRKGDYRVQVVPNLLVTTVIGGSGGVSPAGETATVSLGARPLVEEKGVPLWSLRTVSTVSVMHPATPADARQELLEPHLSMSRNRIQGTITNHGSRAVTAIELLGSSGQQAVLAGSIGPGATVTVDAPLEVPATAQTQPNGSVTYPTSRASTTVSGNAKQDAVLRLAADRELIQRPGYFALVGLAEAQPGLTVEGARPQRSVIAAVSAAVALESSDVAQTAYPRLVSIFSQQPNFIDVYDFDVAGTNTPTPVLRYTFPVSPTNNPAASPVKSIEIYDWASGTWRAAPPAGVKQGVFRLHATEVAANLVRVRVKESNLGNSILQVSPT